MDKLVTVIMPVYNAEQFLKDSIGDIKKQTYPFWELICVDDGSTDMSLKILRQFQQKDERIKVFHQENQGAAQARNKAMGYVSGEYVLFLDADDRFMADLLEKTVQQMEKLKTDILIFDADCFDSQTGQKLPSEWLVVRHRIPNKPIFYFQDFPENILLFSHSVPWNKLYRVDFLKDNNMAFQELFYEEDVVFVNMAYIKAKRMAFLDEKLIRYRQNNNYSLSGTSARNRYPLCVYDAMETLRQQLIKEGIYRQIKKSFANYAAEHFLWNLEVMDGDSFDCLFEKTKEYFTEIIGMEELEPADFIRDDLYRKTKFLCKSNRREYLFFLLQEKRQVIEKVNRDFAGLLEYSVKLKSQLELMKTAKRWRFENQKVTRGSRLILYGAGDVGKDYFEQFKRDKQYHLVAWVDQKYKKITGTEFKIEAPEAILEYEYDYVIIAVCDPDMIKEIRKQLYRMGIPDFKIEGMFA